MAFALFLIFLLFAGWYLDVQSDTPERLYLSFVLQATNYLVLILAMFLSSFSLPNDIKHRTIYTVVTKPVRAWEIVLGRIVGFGAMGSVLTALMWGASYIFVVGGLWHSHAVDLARLEPVGSPSTGPAAVRGQTQVNSQHRHTHRHTLLVDSEGQGSTDRVMSHWHPVTRSGTGQSTRYQVGPPRDALQARVPILGTLQFLNRSGQPANENKGINVGREWTYRGYIAGGTRSAAIWTFNDISQRQFPRGLNLEMTIRVFRTFVGDIERGISGTIVLQPEKSGHGQHAAPVHGPRVLAAGDLHRAGTDSHHAGWPEAEDRSVRRPGIQRLHPDRRAVHGAGAVFRHGAGRSVPAGR